MPLQNLIDQTTQFAKDRTSMTLTCAVLKPRQPWADQNKSVTLSKADYLHVKWSALQTPKRQEYWHPLAGLPSRAPANEESQRIQKFIRNHLGMKKKPLRQSVQKILELWICWTSLYYLQCELILLWLRDGTTILWMCS